MKVLSILLFTFLIALFSFSQEISEIEQSFENTWQAYEDNYAFFNMDSIDWHKQYTIYRDKVTPTTTEDELISILSAMISPLNDGHSFILKGEDFRFATPERNDVKEEIPRLLKDSLWNVCFSTLKEHHFAVIKDVGPDERNTSLYYYTQSDKLGYIRISRFYGKEQALFDGNYQITDSLNSIRLFDSILGELGNTQGLILDIRYNGGGNLWCYDLVRRFLSEKRTDSYKNVRKKGDYWNFTEMAEHILYPSDSINYCKPMVVLTNHRTASAAERFLLAIKDLSDVTVVGSNTKGKLSNSMNYAIDEKNELWGTLSNERIYDSHKKCFEKIGIPADFELMNTLTDLQNSTDSLILKAIEILDNKD